MSDYDVIVVGAGPGGLSTAAYLATNGKRVLVLEANQVVGGSTQVFRRVGNKYEFDVGTHYIGDCHKGGKVDTVLRGLALDQRIEFLRQKPDGHCHVMIPGTTFRTPTGWDEYLARLIEAFPDEEPGLRRCVGILQGLTNEKRGLTFLRWGLRPITKLFAACGLSSEAQAIILGENGDYTWAPSRTPAVFHANFLDHYLMAGAYYPRGGGQVMAGHLVDVIQSHGSTVRTKARVAKILIRDGRAAGVRLASGEEISAATVVSNADYIRTWRDLVGDEYLTRRLRRRLPRLEMTLPMFTVYVALDVDLRERDLPPLAWIWPDTDNDGYYRKVAAGEVPDRMPVGVSCPTAKDDLGTHSAPPGYSTLELVSWAPPQYATWNIATGPADGGHYSQDEKYLALKHQLTEAVLETTTALIPDLRERMVFCEASTPITQERFTLSTGGTCYGLAPKLSQLGPFRPDVTTHIPGLYLTGGSTRYMFGIAATLYGGIGTASAILGRDLESEIRAGVVFANDELLTAGGTDWDPLIASKPSSSFKRRPRRDRSRA
ncbi:MAG: NAD(P)/FAD-dependent oxidoreductase [Nocardiaceae bacterium]|nr:NAD(P)/FAD-dependent oxidoreductase [Nocardiaceae bacterium]